MKQPLLPDETISARLRNVACVLDGECPAQDQLEARAALVWLADMLDRGTGLDRLAWLAGAIEKADGGRTWGLHVWFDGRRYQATSGPREGDGETLEEAVAGLEWALLDAARRVLQAPSEDGDTAELERMVGR